MEEAEKRLEGWIRHAVEEAQDEVFGAASDGRLDDSDLRTVNEADEALKERGEGGLWGSVRYRLYVEEGDGGDRVALDTFGVPNIPPDLEDVAIDEEERRRYNDALSDYGVVVSRKVEEQFEDWRGEA
jgi:hypothetical protein